MTKEELEKVGSHTGDEEVVEEIKAQEDDDTIICGPCFSGHHNECVYVTDMDGECECMCSVTDEDGLEEEMDDEDEAD
jgi:hypothetical protein